MARSSCDWATRLLVSMVWVFGRWFIETAVDVVVAMALGVVAAVALGALGRVLLMSGSY